MLVTLRRFVDVRPGEGRQLILAAVILFAMVAGHMMLETARDALFLEELPARRLPLVYAALAGLALIAIAGSDRLVRFAGRRNALVATLTAAIYGTVVFYLLPRSGAEVFALYLWSGLIGTVIVIQFWIFAGQIFTVEQAKRLFGPLAAGGALGALVGASVSRLVVELVPVESLLLTGAGMFTAAAFALTAFPADVGPSRSGRRPSRRGNSAAALLRRYPYIGRLLGLVAIATVTVLTVDYAFKEAAERHVEDAALGGFFATYYTVFAAASLLFQLVGAGFLLRRLGILAALLVMPAMLVLGGAATAVLGGALLGAVLTKGVDGSMRHSLHRVSTELLWMPLPAGVRARAKGILDGGLNRGVQAATAAGLLGLSAAGLASPAVLGVIIAALASLWIVLALSLRRPYLELYRQSLARAPAENPIDLDLNSLEVLVEALSSADDREVIAAMRLLAAKGRARLIPSLILYHGEPEVLLEALRLIATGDRKDWIPIAVKLLEHGDEAVRASALGALARRGEIPDLSERSRDVSPRVRARALFWRVQKGETEDAAEDPEVRELLAAEHARAPDCVAELLRAIAEDGDNRWSAVVLELLDSSRHEVEQLAVSATGVLRDPRFIPVLVGRLGARRGRSAVRAALIELGPPALDALEEALRDLETPIQIRLHLPRTVALFRTSRAARVLLEQLGREPIGAVRYRALQVLARLVVDRKLAMPREPIIERLAANLREHFRLLALAAPLDRGTYELPPEAVESADLLRGLLADKRGQALDRCFLLLQVAHPREDIPAIQAALAGSDAATRANALEFVDNMTLEYRRHPSGAEVHQLIRLALDDLSAEERVRRAGAVTAERPATYDQAVLALAADEDETTAAIAIYHAALLDLPHLLADVAELCRERSMVEAVGPELAERIALGAARA